MKPRIDEETEIDVLELLGVLFKRVWTIVLAAIIFGAVSFGYTFTMVAPQYKASALMYVNNSDISIGSTSVTISSGQLTAAQRLVDTYIVILTSRTTLNEVINEAQLDCSYSKLKSMISSAAVNETEIFEVVVTSTDPYEAELIANTIAKVLPTKIADIVAGSDVRIVDYAVVPAHRSSPSYTRNTTIGALLGAVLSSAVIIIQFLMNENICSEDYLTKTYSDIPLLTVVPDMNTASTQKSYYAYHSYSKGRKKTGSQIEGNDPAAENDMGEREAES